MIKPVIFDDADAIADAVIADVGKNIVLALPLGLGKANHIANALYARAVADPSIQLQIFTALTPERPKASSELEHRFLDPVLDRLLGGYPALTYAEAAHKGTLPSNITVSEFFFLAGKWISVPSAQQNYISANYTHAARYIMDRGVNVVAQLVSKRIIDGELCYNLSCNTDMTLDLLSARAAGKANFKLVAQVNSELPFMPGEAIVGEDAFRHVLDSRATDFPLFAPPKEPINLAEYATGFHVASLIPDGGTLQFGIGQISDAVTQALILRHTKPDMFRDIITKLSPNEKNRPVPECAPFSSGLHAVSEMFVDAFLELIKAGILKRVVDGALLRSAFFLGSKSFYRALREMDEASLSRLQMCAVSYTNELYGDEAKKRRQRVGARFVNNAMMATLLGAVVSDALEDGRVVSGVGGQYNFVSQAFALDDARSIITLKSTRVAKGKVVSNILWSYGHQTIPRHLRDIIVTEYGVADLRGKTDREIIASMLAVTDSRFQSQLLRQAKAAGKIEEGFEIPDFHKNNFPSHIRECLSAPSEEGLLPAFPFGTDFSEVEQRLLPVLQSLKSAPWWRLFSLMVKGAFASARNSEDSDSLERLGIAQPKSIREHAYRMLVLAAFRET